MQDIVTDFNVFESDDMQIDGIEDAYAHGGMLNAAQYIAHKLIGGSNESGGVFETDKPILEMAPKVSLLASALC